jgi:hypothetical protein
MAPTKAVKLQLSSLPDVEEFLSQGTVLPFINGKYVRPGHGETFQTVDPGSGEVLAEVASCGAGEIEQAVQAAESAFQESLWAKLPPNERAVFLHRLADLVERKKDVLTLLESLDCGKILSQAAADIGNFTTTLRVLRRPLGTLAATIGYCRLWIRSLEGLSPDRCLCFHHSLELSFSLTGMGNWSGLGGGQYRGGKAG